MRTLLLVYALLLVSCAHQGPLSVNPSAVRSPRPVPSAMPAAYPRIQVGSVMGATPAEVTMIGSGASLVNKTMADPCFKAKVLSSSYTETNGLNQEQVWDKISSAPVVVNVEMYTGSWRANHISHTIGYENDPGTVHMNRYFVRTPEMVASNLAHEGEGHSWGFTHYANKATSEPYGMNEAVDACLPRTK